MKKEEMKKLVKERITSYFDSSHICTYDSVEECQKEQIEYFTNLITDLIMLVIQESNKARRNK